MGQKPLYSDETMPVVASNQVLAFNQRTHGRITFNRRLTEKEMRFLDHGRLNPLAWLLSGKYGEFNRLMAEDGYEPEELLAIMSLIKHVRPHEVVFGSKKNITDHQVTQAVYGLHVLNLLSVFGKDLEYENVYIQFRVSDIEVAKASLIDGRITARKGWLVPVWRETQSYL